MDFKIKFLNLSDKYEKNFKYNLSINKNYKKLINIKIN
jgi:hypothetical protein